MSIQKILKMGDSRLLRVADRVDHIPSPELKDLVQNMFDTMTAASGAGLAATQIGVNLQVIVFGNGLVNPRYPDAPPVPRTVLINPVITPIFVDQVATEASLNEAALDLHFQAPEHELEEGWEGCLSVPGIRGVVKRFRKIRYQGLDEVGNPIDRIVERFHARVVQHEYDHLHGILFPMRVKDFSRFGYISVLFPELKSEKVDD